MEENYNFCFRIGIFTSHIIVLDSSPSHLNQSVSLLSVWVYDPDLR